MGGDFRQILPVIRGGSREDIVRASISKSYLWKHVRLFQLTENMRLANENTSPAEKKTISEFSKWILDLGNGKLPAKAIRGEDDEATWIQIPEDLLMTCEDDQDPIEAIADAIYPDLIDNYNNKKYLRERCILSPKNEEVDKINDIMVAKIPRKERVYYSSDSISPLSMDFANAEMTYNQEYLNSQKLSGVPNHILRLKVGLPVMLTRNLNPSAGLCNGTRLIVTLLKKRSIQATVVTGTGAGRKVSIPRIVIQPTESHLPFILRRVQLPIKVCFAMTINKSQGQSIDNVGIYLPKPTFTHGQLYVAVSRTTSRKGLKILLEKTKDAVPEDYTQNIVYKEIFSNLKPVSAVTN
ncbi:hypothetical protein MKW94_011639 [Papaver nudicaule]|uniref:ATP-dependent DNA helicase n=1 Tax=Papaver nudicaule TaxID=74823 RepID=A0AA41RUU3_PAPNU|nr:hypothetical protein [Papaver nudicaule]